MVFYTITGGKAEVCVRRDNAERWKTDMGRAAAVTHSHKENSGRFGTGGARSRDRKHSTEFISAEKGYSLSMIKDKG